MECRDCRWGLKAKWVSDLKPYLYCNHPIVIKHGVNKVWFGKDGRPMWCPLQPIIDL